MMGKGNGLPGGMVIDGNPPPPDDDDGVNSIALNDDQCATTIIVIRNMPIQRIAFAVSFMPSVPG